MSSWKRRATWQRERMELLLVFTALLACYHNDQYGTWGCACPSYSCDDLNLSAPGAYAVGGEGRLEISLFGFGTRHDTIATVEASSERADVFEVLEATKCGIRLAVHQAGTSRISVKIRDSAGDEEKAEIVLEARVPTALRLEPTCAAAAPAGDAAVLLPVESECDFALGLVNGDDLIASQNRPIDPGVLTFVQERESEGCAVQFRQTLVYRTPSFPTQTQFSSVLVPAFSLPVRVYDRSDLDSFGFARPRGTDGGTLTGYPGETRQHPLEITVAGALPCQLPQGWTKTVTTETPEVCAFPDAPDAQVDTALWSVAVRGVAPGTCRLKATLSDTDFSGTLEYEIVAPPPGPDAGAPDAADADLGDAQAAPADAGDVPDSAESMDAGDAPDAVEGQDSGELPDADQAADAGETPDALP